MKELDDLAESVRTKLNLKYDASSIKFIEGFIERNKGSFEKEEWQGLINSLGSFLGKCIIENYGGQWELNNETGSAAIAFDNNNKVYPFAKVSKQFENGLVDSIYSFFRVIPTVFKLDKKKKPWWKF